MNKNNLLKTLQDAVDNSTKMDVFLANGIRLNGIIKWQNLNVSLPCIGLEKKEDDIVQIVLLAHVVTISPSVFKQQKNITKTKSYKTGFCSNF